MIFLRKFKKFVAHFFTVFINGPQINEQMIYVFVETSKRKK